MFINLHKKYYLNKGKLSHDYILSGVYIGKGSFGVIQKITRKSDNKQLVLKAIPISKLKDISEVLTLCDTDGKLYEFEIWKMLTHPNIVPLCDYWEDQVNFYAVTPKYNTDLYAYLENYDYLNPEPAITIYAQLIDALDYMHKHNVIHRDIKLENIFIESTDPYVKIVLSDFGFSTIQKPTDPLLDNFPGSLPYSAPELVQGRPYKGRLSDIWATGVVLFALLTGELPYYSYDADILVKMIMKDPVELPSYGKASLTCKNLVKWLLTKDYTKRPSIPSIRHNKCFQDHLNAHYIIDKTVYSIETLSLTNLKKIRKLLI